MSYRCQICPAAVPAGTPRLTHRVPRRNPATGREETAAELAVCPSCRANLAAGWTVARLADYHRRARAEAAREVVTVEVAAPPPPPAPEPPRPAQPAGRPVRLVRPAPVKSGKEAAP